MDDMTARLADQLKRNPAMLRYVAEGDFPAMVRIKSVSSQAQAKKSQASQARAKKSRVSRIRRKKAQK